MILSPSWKIQAERQIDKCNPTGSSDQYLKWIQFEGFTPTEEYLKVLSSLLPSIENIYCANVDFGAEYRNEDARHVTSFTFDLTAFKTLKSFHLKVEAVVDLFQERGFDYLLFRFKYPGDDDAFYSIQGGAENRHPNPYQLTTATKQFFMECSQNEELSKKVFTFKCSNKIEEVMLSCCHYYFGKLHFGQLVTVSPDPYTFFHRIFCIREVARLLKSTENPFSS